MIDFYLVICCLTAFFLINKSCDIFNFFNPSVYFFWIYLLFCTFGFFYRDLYDYAIDISNKTVGIIGAGLITYSLGVFLASNKRSKKTLKTGLRSLIDSGVQEHNFGLAFALAFCVIPFLFALLFTVQAGEILWLQENFDDQRIEVRKGAGWIAILGIASAYIATIFLGIYAYRSNKFAIPFAALSIVLISGISFGNRAPAVDIVIIFFTFFWIKKFNRISALHFGGAFIVLMIFMVSLGILRQGLEFDAEMITKQLLWRPFVNVQNIEWAVDLIPSTVDYFYGQSTIIELMVLAPGYQPNFGTYMKELMGLEFSGGSITFGAIGMLYADFGATLAVFGMLGIGYILQQVYFRYSRSGIHFIKLIIASTSLKGIAVSGVISPIIYTLIPCWIIYTTVKYVRKKGIST